MNKKILVFSILLSSVPVFAQSKGFSSFEENGLYGFKDKKGKVVIKPQYQHVMEFTKTSVAFVVSKNKWICIDAKNKPLLESFVYDNGPDYISEKLARFVENGKMGFHDESCKKIILAEYDFVFPFENGLAIVCNGCYSESDGDHSSIVGGKYGVINKKGKLVVPIEYDSINSIDAKTKTIQVKKDQKIIKIKLK
ncbi:WG repeat-containing protein [Leptospira sp. 96542]|nr:WG repeat-containing protein [Leptospira sp. 96542]